jgi:conjugative relaxase-like TrwC/TraI family protein
LTFSAPKSVSLLFGIGDDDVRRAIQGAHDHAVREALAYVERESGVTRRGAGGSAVIAGRGLIGAAFRHRTSRAGDPQLHTHVLVANLVLGADGQWGTLDGRRIYAHAKTAGYLYEHRLRALLTRELGFEWAPVRNGIADVAGVSPAVRRAFSRRRVEIEAEMARRGATSAGAAQVAALATRRAKDYRVAPERLAPEWRERAAVFQLDAVAVRAIVGRVREVADADVDALFDRLGGPDGLTAERSTFTRHDVLQALAEGLPAGANVAIAELERIADRFLGLERVVVLADGEPRRDFTTSDGRVIGTVPTERRYSTPELLERERRVLDYARETAGARRGVGRESSVERSLKRRPTIAGEQAAMVRRLLLGGDGVAVVTGRPAPARRSRPLPHARHGRAAGTASSVRRWREGQPSSSRTVPGLRARASRRCSTSCGGDRCPHCRGARCS